MMLSKTNVTTSTLSLVFLQVLLIASQSIAHSYWEAADNYYYWATLSESESTLECTDASNDPPTAKIIRVPKTEQPKNDVGLPDVFEGDSSGTFVFPVGSGKGAIAGIAVDPQYIWFTSPTSKQFGRLEKSAFESLDDNSIVQDEAEYFDVTSADKPYGIAVDPDKVWITHQESERVASYSRTTGEEIDSLDYATEGVAGTVPWGIAVDKNFVWVTNQGSTLGTDSVIQIDRVTGELVREIMVLPHKGQGL